MAQYDPRVELCFDKGSSPSDPAGWVWTDVTDYVIGPVNYSAGRQDESGRATESSIGFTVLNDDGRFTPGNVNSPYYELLDLGTPVRITENTLSGNSRLYFGGLDSDGYAATPDHSSLDITGDIDLRADIEPYSWFTSLANDAVALHIAGKYTRDTNNISYLLNLHWTGKLELVWSSDGTNLNAVQSTVAVPNVNGRLAVRATLDVNNGAAGKTISFYTSDSLGGTWTALGSPVVLAGTTSIFSGSAPLTVGRVDTPTGRAFINTAIFDGRIYGVEIRNGIGGAVVADPDFTMVRGNVDSFTDSTGKVWGVLVTPTTFVEDAATRAWGYVDSIAPQWPAGDVEELHGGAGGHSTVDFSASGIFRRMGQVNEPLRSVMTRSTLRTDPTPKAYWPLEDGKDAVKFASALPGQQPMFIRDLGFYSDPEYPDPAGYSDFLSSAPVVVAKSGVFVGETPLVEDTGELRVTGLFYIPADGLTDVEPSGVVRLFQVETSGTAGYWTIDIVASDGTMRVNAYTRVGGSNLMSSGVVSFSGRDPRGKKGFISLRLLQVGANIGWQIAFFEEGGIDAGQALGTLNSNTMGTLYRVTFNGQASFSGGGAFGHISVYDSDVNNVIWDLAQDVLIGYQGELAGERFVRLCSEEGISYRLYGDVSDTEPMGIQRVDTLTNLLEECASTDGGLLYETKNTEGLTFRTHFDMYSQAAVSFDADSPSGGDIANPFTPVYDDQLAANDVTASRADGGSYTVTDPDNIARRGKYSTDITVNVASELQLPDIAGELLSRGTQAGMRYPQVSPAPNVNEAVLPVYGQLNLGDKLRVTNLPSQHPESSVELLMQGYSADMIPYSYDITANTVNADTWDVAEFAEPWNVDPDAPMRADAENSSLAASATTSDTALSVRTLDGPPWVRYDISAVDFPFDVNIGGEQIRVSQIADSLYDDFNRTASSGWGTAPNGSTYTVSGGSTSDYSVSSGTARQLIADATRTVWRTAVVGPSVDQPEFYGRVLAPAVATTDIYAAGLMLGTAASHYKFALLFNTNSTVDAFLSDEGNILAGTSAYKTGMGYAANTWFNIKARVYNGEVGMKVWKDGDTEPSIWQLHTQNTSRPSSGSLGFTAVRQATNSNTNLTVQFDDLRLSSHQTFTVTRSVNGVSKSHSAAAPVKLWTPAHLAR